MRNYLMLLLLISSAVLCSAQARYFGPYDCDQRCMDRVHTFSNVAMIKSHRSDPEQDVQQIEHARSLGMKVILSRFPDYLLVPRADNNAGQQHEWDRWVGALKPYKSDIVAIYAYDEPYLRAINKKYGDLWKSPKSERPEIIKSAKVGYETAAGRIKANFPGIPLIYVEFNGFVNDSLEIPNGYDWIGTDCYAGWDQCHGNSIPGFYEILESKLKPGQRLVAVLPGFVQQPKNATVGPREREQLSDLIRKYGDFVRTHPRFIAALIWSYESNPRDSEIQKGLEQLDDSVLAEYAAVAREIGVK